MDNKDLPASPVGDAQRNLTDTNDVLRGLTKLEYACIHLGVAATGDADLDRVIREAERRMLAGMAMAALCSNMPSEQYQDVLNGVRGGKYIAHAAKTHSHALLAALDSTMGEEHGD